MSDTVADLSGAKRRIVERLKRVDSATAPELAAEFGLTDTAIRQHLEALESAHLVRRDTSHPTGVAHGRGRPPTRWTLTPAASTLFTDRHADLTVELLATIRESLGEEALESVIRARADRQLAGYRDTLDRVDTPAEKVRLLAELRNAEGYLAEAGEQDGRLTLIEHHCPIREAADHCHSLCSAELDLFSKALGPSATVAREQHLLDGGHRCAYVITPT